MTMTTTTRAKATMTKTTVVVQVDSLIMDSQPRTRSSPANDHCSFSSGDFQNAKPKEPSFTGA